MSNLPSGTVTFLFTDIEGSTPLWERLPETMPLALQIHDDILNRVIQTHQGIVFKVVGDAFQAAFETAHQALETAIQAQRGLLEADWGDLPVLRVRMGLHTGEATPQNGDYAASHTLNRTARITSAGHGGEILLSAETAELAHTRLPPSVILKDLGEHYLKGLSIPEHLFQVVAPGLSADFPPLQSQPQKRSNLPRLRTHFIGREKEITRVKALLAEWQLVTLTGTGGVGKTRLSLQASSELLDAFPDGLWFVELAPVSEPALIPQSMASVLGVREEPGRPVLESLILYLRSKTILLLLDNCEHLIDACARLVDTLLKACPNLKILASSREALGVEGEAIFRVPSLSFPDPMQLPPLESLKESEAVQLFTDRARAVLLEFQVGAHNAQTVARICQRLDGIPLALELAAARLNMLAIEQVASRLDNAFRLLTGGIRTVLPRHQTLRAAIDWSYNLLTDSERSLLRRLSVFAGGWTLEAAETVCSGDGLEAGEVLERLASLVKKSMVVADLKGALETRYNLLETVRQYAQEKQFDAGESESVMNRHRDWFLAFAETAEPRLRTGERLIWTQKLEADHDNLRRALEWSFSDPSGVEAGLRIATALGWRFWMPRGYLNEGRRWLQKGLSLSAEAIATPDLLRVRALNAAGILAGAQNDVKVSTRYLTESIRIARSLEAAGKAELALALVVQALWTSVWEDAPVASRALVKEGLELCRTLQPPQPYLLAYASFVNALIAIVQGEAQVAQASAEESYRTFLETGNRWEGGPLWVLGTVAQERGQYSQAQDYFTRAVEMNRECDDVVGEGSGYLFLSRLALRQGNDQQAAEYVRKSIRLWQEIGGMGFFPAGLIQLAYTEITQAGKKPPQEAREHYRRAACLFGAARGFPTSPHAGISLLIIQETEPWEKALHLGLDRAALAESWAEGQSMTFEQALAYALAEEHAR